MKFCFLLVLCLCILQSCSKKNTCINEKYLDQQIENAILLIHVDQEHDFVFNEQVFHEVGVILNEQDVIELFNQTYPGSWKYHSEFRKVSFLKINPAILTKQKTLIIDDEKKVQFCLPEKSIKIDMSGNKFILLQQNFAITFSKKSFETSNPGKKYAADTDASSDAILSYTADYRYYMTVRTEYALYDNQTAEVVCFGSVSAKDNYNAPHSFNDFFYKVLADLIEQILERTPFEKEA